MRFTENYFEKAFAPFVHDIPADLTDSTRDLLKLSRESIRLLAELTFPDGAGLHLDVAHLWECQYCCAEAQSDYSGFIHEASCEIRRAREWLVSKGFTKK